MSNIVNYDAAWAEQAEAFAENETVSTSNYLSTRGGSFSMGDEDLGRELVVVVTDAIRENVLYTGKYNPDSRQSPLCFAFGRAEADMAPEVAEMQKYPDVFTPQAKDCASCQHNQWGSAETGRGKACKNQRRLAILPAGFFHPPARRGAPGEAEIFTDEKHYVNADMAVLKLPVTSVKEWAKYVKQISSTVQRPPYGVVTRLSIEPDRDTQYRLEFEMLDLLPGHLIDVMYRRHSEAGQYLASPYRPWEDREERTRYDDRQPQHSSRRELLRSEPPF